MTGNVKCSYCANWETSPIQKIINFDKENSDDKKKKGKKKKKRKQIIIKQYRICKLNDRKIKGTTKICKFFKPRLFFYCYNSNYWLSIFMCLARRRNRKSYIHISQKTSNKKDKIKFIYPDCTVRCAQFRDDILPICDKLQINRLGKIKRNKVIRKIKRRNQNKRVIKRRTKRTIKRRT